jgi:hypothetical protein
VIKSATNLINSIKTNDFSTLHTTIPHEKLKCRVFNTIDNCFFHKNGKRKHSYQVLSHQKQCFVKYHSDSTHKYTEVEIKKMLEFLIDIEYIRRCWWSGLPTACLDSHGYELCPFVSGSGFFYIHMRRNSFKTSYMRIKNFLQWPSIRHFDISTMFYLLTTINFTHMSTWYILMSWKSKTPQSASHLLRI